MIQNTTSLVGPLTTDQPLETRSGWQRQQPPPTRRAGIITALSVAACVFPFGEAVAAANTNAWAPTAPPLARVHVHASRAHAATVWVSTFAEGQITPPTDWRPNFPDTIDRLIVDASRAQPALVWVPTFAQGNASAPTDWRPNFPDRHWTRVKPDSPSYVAAPNLTIGIVPDVGGASIATGSVPILQYLGLFAPMDSGAAIELRTAWFGTATVPVRARPGLHASLHRAHVTDTVLAPTPATVPDITWNISPSVVQRPCVGVQAQISGFAAITLAEDTSAFSWRPQYPSQHLRKLRQPYTPLQPHFAVVIQVPVMSWTGSYLEPQRRTVSTHAVRPSLIGPLDVEGTVQAIDRLSFRANYPATIDRMPARHWAPAVVHPYYIADQTVIAPTRSWAPRYDDLVIRGRFLEGRRMPHLFMDAMYEAPAAVTVPDLPYAIYPDAILVRAHRRQSELAQVLGLVDLPDVGITWSPTYPDRHPRPFAWTSPLETTVVVDAPPGWLWVPSLVIRAPHRQAAYLWTPSAFDFQDRVPEGSWTPVLPDASWRRLVLVRGTLPHLFMDPQWTAPTPVIVPDMGSPVYPDRVIRRTVQAHDQQAFAMDAAWTAPTPAVVPGWSGPIFVDYVHGRAPLTDAPAWFSQPYVSDVTEPVPALSWEPVWPDFIWRQIFAAAQQQASTGAIYVPDVTTARPDLWTVIYPDRVHRFRPFPSGYVVIPMEPSLLDYIPVTADVVIVVRGDVGIILVRPDTEVRVQ